MRSERSDRGLHKHDAPLHSLCFLLFKKRVELRPWDFLSLSGSGGGNTVQNRQVENRGTILACRGPRLSLRPSHLTRTIRNRYGSILPRPKKTNNIVDTRETGRKCTVFEPAVLHGFRFAAEKGRPLKRWGHPLKRWGQETKALLRQPFLFPVSSL